MIAHGTPAVIAPSTITLAIVDLPLPLNPHDAYRRHTDLGRNAKIAAKLNRVHRSANGVQALNHVANDRHGGRRYRQSVTQAQLVPWQRLCEAACCSS
jgi:hypothetical protein